MNLHHPPQVQSQDWSEAVRLDDEYSARRTFTRVQSVWAVLIVLIIVIAVALRPLEGFRALIGIVTLLYVSGLVFRLITFTRALANPQVIVVSDEDARRYPLENLPMYSVLVPAFREPEVIGHLVASIRALEYPPDRLDVKLLLEEDDQETILAAAAASRDDPYIEIVLVPRGEPRTKPRACNYGLLLARGELVTIYDAEDRPEPLQLRRAVKALRELPTTVACLQAKLVYYNPDQNMITRWFSTEYAMWFSQLLPGLVRQNVPLPLGGTSNHFRREVLRRIGAWDPWNVTEDADLGIRLHRSGYRTAVLDSITLEEANSDFINWVRQRSRWYKGYMQTWLVHMRHPVRLWRELGPGGFIGFQLFVGGTPLLALLNPVFWISTVVWFAGRPDFMLSLFEGWIYYVGVLCLVFGNFLYIYASMISAREFGSPALVFAAMLSPIYWAMMSVAAIKASVQLLHAPSFWEKTVHGLDVAHTRPEPVSGPAAEPRVAA